MYSAEQLAELVCDESDSDDDFDEDCPVDHVRAEDSNYTCDVVESGNNILLVNVLVELQSANFEHLESEDA